MKHALVLSFRRPRIDARLARSLMRLAAAIEGELEPFEHISSPRLRTQLVLFPLCIQKPAGLTRSSSAAPRQAPGSFSPGPSYACRGGFRSVDQNFPVTLSHASRKATLTFSQVDCPFPS